MEEKNKNLLPHNIVLEDRKHLTVSGVMDVDSFDEMNIVALTSLGEMTVSVSNLRINRFSTDVGELAIDGEICAISYSENSREQGGFFSRIFR
ncbi:MAG: sporulation protein YabP [Clostridia bacterium]|nr:sporulation protein YabP [Clostridia bacterium]